MHHKIITLQFHLLIKTTETSLITVKMLVKHSGYKNVGQKLENITNKCEKKRRRY